MAQLVEYNLAKVGVAGSSPVYRSQGFRIAKSFFCNNLTVKIIVQIERDCMRSRGGLYNYFYRVDFLYA